MKKCQLVLVFLFLLSSLTASEQKESDFPFHDQSYVVFQKGDKLYLNEEHIFFDHRKIFLELEDGTVEINSISSDQEGVYLSVADEKWPWTPFICRNCGRGNPSYYFVCEYCGEPRPD